MLKYFVGQGNFKGPINKIAETLEDRKKIVQKKSLGNLTKEYFRSFSSSMEHIHKHPHDRSETWESMSVQIENEDGILPRQKAAFRFFVSEQNRSIHQMLVGFDPESTESCKALINKFDDQDVMIQREYTNLQHLLKAFHEARKELLKEFKSNG